MKSPFARFSRVQTAACLAVALLIIAGGVAVAVLVQGSGGAPSMAAAGSPRHLSEVAPGIDGAAAPEVVTVVPETPPAGAPAAGPAKPEATARRSSQPKPYASPAPTTNAIATPAQPSAPVTGGPTISCDLKNNSHPIDLTKGQTLRVGCEIKSNGGFSAPTTLSCARVTNPFSFDLEPGPFPCSFSPGVVTPPVDGTVSASYTLYVPADAEWGNYSYGIRTDSAAPKRLEPMWPINLRFKQPDLNVACDAPPELVTSVNQQSSPVSCQVTAPPGFDDTVSAFSSPNNAWGAVKSPCDIQPSVTSLTFGPAGGTQELSFTVTCTSETYDSSFLVRFQSGTGNPAQFVDISISVRAVAPAS
jgi:hypothetical protein